jgi:hypothetical protein
MLVVCLISAAASVLVVLRWTTNRVDTLGRTRSFPILATGIPVAVAFLTGIPVVQHAQLEHHLAAVASQLAGVPVTVRCETLGQAWTDAHPESGYVWFGADGRPEHSATITWQTCSDLGSWMGSDRTRASIDQIVAVHVLTHEAMHLAGLRNEAAAECAAVQRDVRAARLLGATPTLARSMAARYWTEIYPRLNDDYRSETCGSDGALDEHLADPPWGAVKSSQNS